MKAHLSGQMFPSEPPEQKPEAGNSLPGHGAHSMQFLWPWARHRTGASSSSCHPYLLHRQGLGGGEPRTLCKSLEDVGYNQVVQGA